MHVHVSCVMCHVHVHVRMDVRVRVHVRVRVRVRVRVSCACACFVCMRVPAPCLALRRVLPRAACRHKPPCSHCLQGDGRDLDPTHTEAQAEGERRSGGGPGGATQGRESRDARAAMQVPEYKQLGTKQYDLVPEDEEGGAASGRAPSAGGKYNLSLPGGGAGPSAAGGPDSTQLQVELAARLLAKASSKKDKKDKKEKKHSSKKDKKHKHSSKKDKKHKHSSKKDKKEKKSKKDK